MATASPRQTWIARLADAPLLASLAGVMVFPLLAGWTLIGGPAFDVARVPVGATSADAPPEFRLATFMAGTYQDKISRRAGAHLPWHNGLVFLNAEVNFSLFGKSSNPNIIADTNGDLYERSYLNEYCSRNLVKFAPRARVWANKLRRLQAHFTARGKAFVYLITPSKVAANPAFAERITHCRSPRSERNGLIPLYRSILDAHGIRTIDGATATRRNRHLYDVDLFGRGYTHWNHLAAAPIVQAVAIEINRQLHPDVVPPFTWSFRVRPTHPEAAGDIAGLMNLIRPRIRYPSPEVSVRTLASEGTACPVRVAAVGGSFLQQFAEVLTRVRCVELASFHYFRRHMIRYPGRLFSEEPPRPGDYAILERARVIILEENEQVVARSRHGPAFYDFIIGNEVVGSGG